MTSKNSQTQSKAIVNLHSRTLTLQLAHSDFLNLYAVFADANKREPENYNMLDMLLHNIIVAIYHEFHVEAKEEKSVYTIQLTPTESLAFWLYWTDHLYDASTLAGKLLDQVNNIILLLFTKSGSSECYI